MKDGRIIDATKMHMLSVKTLKGNIESPPGIDPIHVKSHSFNFLLGHGLDLEQKLVGLELQIDIEALGKTDEPLGIKGSYTHEIVFRVENLEDFVERAEPVEESEVDFVLMATLVGIAYSTVRGIIFSRTQGTSLGTIILPVVDPKRIMGNPAENENPVVQVD